MNVMLALVSSCAITLRDRSNAIAGQASTAMGDNVTVSDETPSAGKVIGSNSMS